MDNSIVLEGTTARKKIIHQAGMSYTRVRGIKKLEGFTTQWLKNSI
jgi:hypothetical protein